MVWKEYLDGIARVMDSVPSGQFAGLEIADLT